MTIEPRLDILGAALADPSRYRILCELMDGRAFTNKELACAARIQPQTATAHLKQLERAGLTSSLRSGRHIYHQIANPSVAQALERLAAFSSLDHLNRSNHKVDETKCARTCYNHIAGRLGVLMTQRLIACEVLIPIYDRMTCGPEYQRFLNDIAIIPPKIPAKSPIAKHCLDWTERRHHISGPFATAVMERFLSARWLERRTGSRALTITDDGFSALERWFGLSRDAINNPSLGENFGR